MARVTVEDCLLHVPDRFALVHLGASRVKLLKKGAKPRVQAPGNRDVVVALREIAAGKVTFADEKLQAEFSDEIKARLQVALLNKGKKGKVFVESED